MDLLAKEIDAPGARRLIKGNSFAFVFRSGRAKKWEVGSNLLFGGCTKNQGLFTFILFRNKDGLPCSGAKTVFVLKFIQLNFVPVFFFFFFLKNRLKL